MDTRTGLIHEQLPGETFEAFEQRFNAAPGDLVPVLSQPPADCPKCRGTGRLRKGLLSRRWKPCVCIRVP